MKTLHTRRANLVGSFIFLAIGVTTFAQMAGLNEQADSSDPGAAGYPKLLATLMIALAVLLAFQPDNGEDPPTRAGLLRVIAAIAVTFAYALVLVPLGYVVATALFVLATMLLMGIKSIPSLILMPIGLALVNFYLFYEAFGVPLPYTFIERLLT